MPIYTAAVSLLAVGLYFSFSLRVAAAHGKYGVELPAMTGHPDFERVFRAHINTLEWMPVFVIPLWITAVYLSDRLAAALGLVWIVGRLIYFIGYSRATEKRIPGFFIQAMACIALFIASLAAVGLHISAG